MLLSQALSFAVVPFLALAAEGPMLPTFEDFVASFGLHYGAAELAARKRLYLARLKEATEHNAGNHSRWTAGVNEMSASTPEELSGLRGHRVLARRDARPDVLGSAQAVDQARAPSLRGQRPLPESIDWREHRPAVVTAVKDQGLCGACWAFAVTQAVETHIALKTGTLEDLSPQQLISCTPPPKGFVIGGCDGNHVEHAFHYVAAAGVDTQWHYPYLSGITNRTGECLRNGTPSRHLAGISGYTQLPANLPQAAMAAVVEHGPLVVTVAAAGWHPYASGIFDGCSEGPIVLDHAVVLMGYGQQPGRDGGGEHWWLVRNSWGANWGERGYLRLARFPEVEPCGFDGDRFVCGECGILYSVAYPTGGVLRRAEQP